MFFFDCIVPLFFLFHLFNVLESRLSCAMTKLWPLRQLLSPH